MRDIAYGKAAFYLHVKEILDAACRVAARHESCSAARVREGFAPRVVAAEEQTMRKPLPQRSLPGVKYSFLTVIGVRSLAHRRVGANSSESIHQVVGAAHRKLHSTS